MTLTHLEAMRHTAQTPSGPVSYLEIGAGRPVLFVHGVGVNALLWRHVMTALAGEARCLALDLPAHGHTPVAPDQDLSLPAVAEVVRQFCDALGLSAVDLVANDTGGAVAQIFAARHPARVRTFTLTNCETNGEVPPPSFQPVVDLAAAGQLAPTGVAMAADPEIARAAAYGEAYEHPERVPDDVLRSYASGVAATVERGRDFERFLTSMRGEDLTAAEPGLRRLEAPTLLVWATGDPTFGLSGAEWLRDTIPGATEIVEVEGAKLFFPEERPDDLVAALRTFWAANEADETR
jgi:pimeloyl-ACP methyl ester carboxylesterase